MPILDHFDLIAPLYERLIQPREPTKLLSLIELPVDGCVLDAGGGTGRISQFFSKFEIEVVVADLSFKMLKKAAEKSNLLVLCAPIENLPFDTETFLRIIMVDALHHVIDQEKCTSELWRVLKKGGRLVIEEPDIQYHAIKMVALAEKMALMRSHFLSPDEIAGKFNYRDAAVRIEREHPNAWVIVEKIG